MNIYLSNFGRRIADYLCQNRARLIRWLLIAAAVLVVAALIYYGVQRWQRGKYEKHINALERQFRDAETKAEQAEARAGAHAMAIEAKEAELRDLEARANAAETAMRKTRTIVIPLKETYEQSRTNPVVAADVPCADVCAELARLGYPCQ